MNIQLLLFSKETGRLGERGGTGGGGGRGKERQGNLVLFQYLSRYLFSRPMFSSGLVSDPSLSKFVIHFFLFFLLLFLEGGEEGVSLGEGSSVCTIYFKGKLCEVFLLSFVAPEYFSGITLPHQHFPVNVLPKDPYLPPLISTQEESVLDNQE